jgi:uncharacterized membrane protein
MSDIYRVIFTGRIDPGRDLEQVIDRFCEKFKLERRIAEKVIRAGRPVSLKKDLPLERAEKYVAVLEHIGIVVEIDPKPPEPVVAPSGLELEPLDHGGGDTTEVLEHVPGVEICPKCGSKNMEMGICQDCGIVAAKYLAAQEAASGEGGTGADEPASAQANPYTAPEADLETPPEEDEMTGPHGVPAFNGLSWIAQGWEFFKESPVSWTLALIIWIVLSMIIGLIPFLGGIAMMLIGPVVMGGFMLGCYEQEQGGSFTIGHLFAGFSNNAGQLMLVGVLYMVMSFGVTLVMGLIMMLMFGSLAALDPQNVELMMASIGPPLLIFVLLFLLIFMVIMMTYIFAPSLVAVDGLDALNAMKLSFKGCLRNILPLLVYGIAATILSLILIVPMILMAINLIPMWLGVVLIMIFMLVMFPVFTASVYSAYRDIYYS